ncbi:MAG: hypothetical protein GY788_29140 [bacterium]|nr:hypothetical protein [bacterium]
MSESATTRFTNEAPRARRLVAVLALATLASTACSGDGSESTVGPAEVISIDQLNAAVRPAAQAILDAPAIQVTTQWFDPDGEHVRTDWLDYRDEGTYVLLGQSIGSPTDDVDEIAWVQLADARFCASAGPDMYCDVDNPATAESWAQQETAAIPADSAQPPVALDLLGMANDGTNVAGFGADQIKTTLQPGLDGEIVWTVETSLDEGSFTRVWRIDADGVLVSYTVGADSGAPLGLYSRSRFEFVIPAKPTPIEAPDLDAPLDLDTMGLPPGLPLLGR